MSTKKYKYCLEVKFFIECDYGSVFSKTSPYGFSCCHFIDKYYGNNKRNLVSFGKKLKERWEHLGYTFEYVALINLEDK